MTARRFTDKKGNPGIYAGRAQALAEGRLTYFPNTPCRHGHICERYANDARCVDCAAAHTLRYHAENALDLREKKRKYEAIHKDEFAQKRKIWRSKNTESIKRRRTEYHEKNRTKIIEKVNLWRKENPERFRENIISAVHARRARKVNSSGRHSGTDRAAILELQRWKCAYCRISLRRAKKHFDHIIPLSRGGTNDRKNIQALCATCNLRKHAKDPVIYAQSLGLLL